MADDSDVRSYTIQGTVSGARGQLLDRAEVIVWWQRIRDRELLDASETTEHGHYRLTYRVPDEAPAKLLIVVEVRSRELESPLESAAIIAIQEQTINLAAAQAGRALLSVRARDQRQHLHSVRLLGQLAQKPARRRDTEPRLAAHAIIVSG